MRFISFKTASTTGLAVRVAQGIYRGLTTQDAGFPGQLRSILEKGRPALLEAADALSRGREVDPSAIQFLPPLADSGKLLCIGLNYLDHSAESGFKPPEYPTVFARFNSSLIGHRAAIVKPTVSLQLDYEGEVAAIIGIGGRHIPENRALQHVAGYSLFNDASIRDFQFKSPQWTVGKNFDRYRRIWTGVRVGGRVTPSAARAWGSRRV